MVFDWHDIAGATSTLVLLVLVVPYVRSITHGTTRPSAVSWFGWSLLFAIATVAQASKGIDWSLVVPLISTASTGIIAITALRVGRAVWTRADGVCVTLAILAIVLWVITKEPLVAIVLSIIADILVTIPTIIKTYEDPSSEPAKLWVFYFLAVATAVVATRDLTLYNLLFPVYTVIFAGVIMVLSLRSGTPKVAGS
ncbi:hypothetical protein HY415_00575 [Candidatus Kaiserbacteria bacterium]|nr:hypothetical protein [Candidatus Kaiserbacteria bacterium]